jgi:hypothetical protein
MSERYVDIGTPLGKRPRSCSVQFGWLPWFSVEAWLDTGYAASRFEFTFGLHVGPWRYDFDWRPFRGSEDPE